MGKRTHDRALEQKYQEKLKTEFPASPEALSKGELFPASVAYTPRVSETLKPVATASVETVKPVPVSVTPAQPQPAQQPAPAISAGQPENNEIQSLTMASGNYSIQVGAFSSRNNAQNLASKLNAKGYAAFIVQEASRSKSLFKVRVGHFSSLAQAKRAEQQLRLQGYPTKIIP